MKNIVFGFLLSFSALNLSGCSPSLGDYANNTPQFSLFSFFDGKVKAYGMIQDYKQAQIRRFTVEIDGSRSGNILTLDEDFVFDDGEKQNRVWTITQVAKNEYEGTAGDVIGIAKGKEVGNAVHWVYDLAINVDGQSLTVTMDDWLYRQDAHRAFNVTSMKKWGVEVGKVTLFFEKQ